MDLSLYRAFKPIEGFEYLGFKAALRCDKGQLRTDSIMLGDEQFARPSSNKSRFSPDWQLWEQAQDIAMATLIIDTIAIRHLLAAHLINVAMIGHFRNYVPEEHPIARLLDPHTIGTIGIHYSQVPVLIGEYAFLSHIFPYEQSTINKMIDTVALQFDFMQYDIEADMLARNMQSPLPFDAPFQDYWLKLYQEYRAGIARFINRLYSSDAEMVGDIAIQRLLGTWINKLLHKDNRSVFNYLDQRSIDKLTRDDLAKLIANYLFLTTVTHEAVGNGLLQYALQGHLMPVAVPKKGSNGGKETSKNKSGRPSVKRYLNLASILLWTSLPKSELGSFYERTLIPESAELENQVNEFWELIRHLMDSFQQDLRLPGAGAPGHLERSVNQ